MVDCVLALLSESFIVLASRTLTGLPTHPTIVEATTIAFEATAVGAEARSSDWGFLVDVPSPTSLFFFWFLRILWRMRSLFLKLGRHVWLK